MRKLGVIAGCVLVLCMVAVPRAWAQEEQPVVRGYLFYSETCPACHQTRTQILPELYRRYGQQLRIKAININESEENYQWLLACEQAFGVPEDKAAIPVLFIGDQYMVGSAEIKDQLPPLIEEHLAQGGLAYPDVPRPGGALEPKVRFMFFFSPSCPHCKYVEETVFPRLATKYGDRVQWEMLDTSEMQSYRALLTLGELAGLPEDRRGSVPVLFVGDEFTLYSLLLGSNQIESYLEPAIEWFMEVGGVDLPGWSDQLFEPPETPSPQATEAQTAEPTPSPGEEPTETAEPTPSPGEEPTATAEASPSSTPTSPSSDPPAIHMAYFAEVGCSECDRVSIALEHLQDRFPNLVIHEYDVIQDYALNLCLSEQLDVPEEQRHDAPAVFVGAHFLVDTDIQYDRLVEIVSSYAQQGAEPAWEKCGEGAELPPPPPWWAVILPGLVDGINPCAFATIVFFISYLSLTERKGRDIILVGAAFTLAVFLSYLMFGMVLREILAGVIERVGSVLRSVLNVAIALLCLLLALFSYSDFRKARRGRVKDMALRLPDKLRKRINATIRHGMRARMFVVAAFVTGVVVSFIELACTGQVYVPIILGLSSPGYRAQSLLALVVYCLAFVVPLIAVFVVSYTGTSSQTLGLFLQRHTANVKLAMVLVFLGMGTWLIYEVVREWMVLAPLVARAIG